MIINDYAEYKQISIDELNLKLQNSSQLIKEDILKFRTSEEDYLYNNSSNLFLDIIKPSFNVDKELMVSKFSLFSPCLLSLIVDSNYKKVLEFMGGTSLFSEIMIGYNKDVTYANVESDMLEFIKWRVEKRNLNIKVKEVARNFKLDEKYDFILSDGVLQLFNEENQYRILDSIVESLNKDGLVALLVDWSGSKENIINYDIDVPKIHEYLNTKDMVCIYGKNTFSSVWKKMI